MSAQVAIAATVAYLAVVWRVLPWFMRRARAAPGCDDVDVYIAALFVGLNARVLHRAVVERATGEQTERAA